MDKMLQFAQMLVEEIRKANEVFLDTEEIPFYLIHFYDMLTGTKLLMEDGNYIMLEYISKDMDLEELHFAVEESEQYLKDYVDEDEVNDLVGILFCNEFLYEVLYDYGMLGDKFRARFREKEKNETIHKLLKTVEKLAKSHNFTMGFESGRIYLRK